MASWWLSGLTSLRRSHGRLKFSKISGEHGPRARACDCDSIFHGPHFIVATTARVITGQVLNHITMPEYNYNPNTHPPHILLRVEVTSMFQSSTVFLSFAPPSPESLHSLFCSLLSSILLFSSASKHVWPLPPLQALLSRTHSSPISPLVNN